MKFQLETPKAVVDAKNAKKGMNWALELLLFVGIFLLASIGQGIILFPIELVLLLTNPAYMSAVESGDMTLITEASMGVANSSGYMIGMLFANIGMIFVVMLFCKLVQKRKMSSLGFVKKDMGKEYGIGLIVGFAIFSAAVLICVLTGSLKMEGFSETFSVVPFILFALGFMIQGMAEEVLCRSYFMVSMARRSPIWVAVLLNSLFFAALHLTNPGMSVLAFINLTLFGVFASVYFVKRGSIWGIGAIHSIWNFVQGNFYGVKVSGMETSCSVFESVAVEGRDLVSGGAFGLEGGIAVTIVLVVGILFLLSRPAKETEEVVVESQAA